MKRKVFCCFGYLVGKKKSGVMVFFCCYLFVSYTQGIFCSFHDCKLSRVGLAKRRLRCGLFTALDLAMVSSLRNKRRKHSQIKQKAK